MWRGVLPCPHCLPSCLPPPPLPDPDRASQTLCSRGWELLGGGFPGEEVSPALLGEEGTLASPPAQHSPAESSWSHAPSPRPSASCLAWSPPVPASRPSPSVYRPPFPLLRHSEVSEKTMGEAEGRGRRNHVASAARRIPRDPFSPHSPGTRRRGRGFPALPRGGGPAPVGRPPGPHPHHAAVHPRVHDPARPRSLQRARVARSHGQDPSPPSGETETL